MHLTGTRGKEVMLPKKTSCGMLIFPATHPVGPSGLPLSPRTRTGMRRLHTTNIVVPRLPCQRSSFSSFNIRQSMLLPTSITCARQDKRRCRVCFITGRISDLHAFGTSFHVTKHAPRL